HGVGYARLLADALEYLGGGGELRNSFRRDEAGHLDGLEARGGEPVDELDLGRRGIASFLVLQPVAPADLDDLDPVREHHGVALTQAEYPPVALSLPPCRLRRKAVSRWCPRCLP